MSEKLAIDGGNPVRTEPTPPCYPGAAVMGEEEKRAVMEVMDSKGLFRFYGFNPLGKTKQFEKDFAQYIGVKYALGVTSGTGALITGLSAFGMPVGSEVIVPAYTFVASIGAIVNVRCIPVLAEIDRSINIDPNDIERKITDKTKAIMPVHMRGGACNMEAVMEIAKKHNLLVIEDCAQATGSIYKGKKVGSIGDIGAFSLQYHKMITAGEGGMITTNDQRLYTRAVNFHDHGHFPDRENEHPGVRQMLGINFRMSELTAAIGIEQLKKLDDKIIAPCRKHQKKVLDCINEIDGLEPRQLDDPGSDVGVCVIFFAETAERAKRFADAVRAENISECWVLSESFWHVYNQMETLLGKMTVTPEGCPFTCPYYGRKIDYYDGMCPQTDDILSKAVHISIPPNLTEKDSDDIVKALRKVASAIL